MAQRTGSVVGLFGLLVAAARSAGAQAVPDPVVTPAVQTRLDSVAPEDSNGERSSKPK